MAKSINLGTAKVLVAVTAVLLDVCQEKRMYTLEDAVVLVSAIYGQLIQWIT